jgi:hypothetical protein
MCSSRRELKIDKIVKIRFVAAVVQLRSLGSLRGPGVRR